MLKQKARRIMTEFVKYQIIAQHKDATLPDHYKPIYEYLQTIDTKQLLEFDFLSKLKVLFTSDDLGFVVEALI